MKTEISTHNITMSFGKYKGELLTRVPINYLEWLINVGSSFSELAQAELDRRGVSKDHHKVEISSHAIDRASLRVLKIWQKMRRDNEGLYSWLVRVSIEALSRLTEPLTEGKNKIQVTDLVLVFKAGKLYPTLVTIILKP